MQNITYKATYDTPQVVLDYEKESFVIKGKSFPSDVEKFFNPILHWLDEYAHNPKKQTIINFELDYYNTASSKYILELLYRLEEMSFSGHNVQIKWHYPEDDEDMETSGIEYSEIVDIPFEFTVY